MKKLIISILMACGLASAVAQDNTDSLFNSKEFGLSLGTGYVVDTSAAFQQDYSFNLSAGTFYSFTRNFLVEANIPFYQSKGVSVSEVQIGAIARLPIGHVAPYVGLGGVFNWNADNELAYVAKVGTEFRLNPKWGIFAEGQYRNDDFSWSKGAVSIAGGIRLLF